MNIQPYNGFLIGVPASVALHAVALHPETVVNTAAITNEFVNVHPATVIAASLAAITGAVYRRLTRPPRMHRPPVSEESERQMRLIRYHQLKQIAEALPDPKSSLDYGRVLIRLETSLLTLSQDRSLPRVELDVLEERLDNLVEKIRTKIEAINDPLKRFHAILRRLARTTYYRYIKSQATLPLALDGYHANCEARAKMFYSVVQRLWSPAGTPWQPTVARYADHVEVWLFNRETGEIYDPNRGIIRDNIAVPLHDPRFFLLGYRGIGDEACIPFPEINTWVGGFRSYGGAHRTPPTNTFSDYSGLVSGAPFGNSSVADTIARVTAKVTLIGLGLFIGLCITAYADMRYRFYFAEYGRSHGYEYIHLSHSLMMKKDSGQSIIADSHLRYTNYRPWNDSRRINFALNDTLKKITPPALPEITNVREFFNKADDMTYFLKEWGWIRFDMGRFNIKAHLEQSTLRSIESLGKRVLEINRLNSQFVDYWTSPTGLKKIRKLNKTDKARLIIILALMDDSAIDRNHPHTAANALKATDRLLSALKTVELEEDKGDGDKADEKKLSPIPERPPPLTAFASDPEGMVPIEIYDSSPPPAPTPAKLPLATVIEILQCYSSHPDIFSVLEEIVLRNMGGERFRGIQERYNVVRSVLDVDQYHPATFSGIKRALEQEQYISFPYVSSTWGSDDYVPDFVRFFHHVRRPQPADWKTALPKIENFLREINEHSPNVGRLVEILFGEIFIKERERLNSKPQSADSRESQWDNDLMDLIEQDPWVKSVMKEARSLGIN